MIYILDNDPGKCAQSLDDKSLSKMIEDIAQVLCNVHREGNLHKVYDKFLETIPLPYKYNNKIINQWSQWGGECVANYRYLVALSLACIEEDLVRSVKMASGDGVIYEWEKSFIQVPDKVPTHTYHKLTKVIWWCRDNVPTLKLESLPNPCYPNLYYQQHTPFPLVMPRKFIQYTADENYTHRGRELETDIQQSYRNYYNHKLQDSIKRKTSKPCMKHDCCIYAQKGYCIRQNIKPIWTRRGKPEWLDIC
jgi:hypothetical protein